MGFAITFSEWLDGLDDPDAIMQAFFMIDELNLMVGSF